MPKRPASISSLRQNVHPGRYFLEPIIGLLRANNKGWPTVSLRSLHMDSQEVKHHHRALSASQHFFIKLDLFLQEQSRIMPKQSEVSSKHPAARLELCHF